MRRKIMSKEIEPTLTDRDRELITELVGITPQELHIIELSLGGSCNKVSLAMFAIGYISLPLEERDSFLEDIKFRHDAGLGGMLVMDKEKFIFVMEKLLGVRSLENDEY